MSTNYSGYSTIYNSLRAVNSIRQANWETYQTDVAKRLEMYEGCYSHYVVERLARSLEPEVWAIYAKKWHFVEIENMMRNIIDRTTKVYSKPAYRSWEVENLEAESQIQEGESDISIKPTIPDPAYIEALESIEKGLDYWMDRALRTVQVTGIVLLRPYTDPKDPKSIKCQLITPDIFEPILAEDDPSQLAGVTYTLDYPDDATKRFVRRTFVWDMIGYEIQRITKEFAPGYLELDDRGKVVQSITGDQYVLRNSSGLPELPFTTITIEAPPYRLCNQSVGIDLFDATVLVNILDLQARWILWNQSHKQIMLSGPGVDKIGNQIIDPTMPIVLPMASEEVKLQILSLETDPAAIHRKKQDIYEQLLIRRGWSYDEFQKTAERQTAESLLIQNRGKSEYNEWLIEHVARPAEHDFAYRLMLVVNNLSSLPQINAEGDLHIDFANPYFADPYAHFEEKMQLVDMNVLSKADLVMEMNPDIKSIDEALEVGKTNAAINRAFKSIAPSIVAVANAVPPPNPPVQQSNNTLAAFAAQNPNPIGVTNGQGTQNN